MEKSFSDSYAAAGVDVTAGYKSVELIKSHVKRTNIAGVLGGIGGFGGMFEIPANEYKNPVLVSGTDGVGTKIKLAFLMDKHDTIGIDCVAMCVNDVACSGAKPLFFLDYIACGKNYPEKIEQIVKGVADGCVQSGCALVGGETAEHPEGLLIPKRSRQKSAVLRTAFAERRPLCPPRPPDHLRLTVPIGSSSSS